MSLDKTVTGILASTPIFFLAQPAGAQPLNPLIEETVEPSTDSMNPVLEEFLEATAPREEDHPESTGREDYSWLDASVTDVLLKEEIDVLLDYSNPRAEPARTMFNQYLCYFVDNLGVDFIMDNFDSFARIASSSCSARNLVIAYNGLVSIHEHMPSLVEDNFDLLAGFSDMFSGESYYWYDYLGVLCFSYASREGLSEFDFERTLESVKDLMLEIKSENDCCNSVVLARMSNIISVCMDFDVGPEAVEKYKGNFYEIISGLRSEVVEMVLGSDLFKRFPDDVMQLHDVWGRNLMLGYKRLNPDFFAEFRSILMPMVSFAGEDSYYLIDGLFRLDRDFLRAHASDLVEIASMARERTDRVIRYLSEDNIDWITKVLRQHSNTSVLRDRHLDAEEFVGNLRRMQSDPLIAEATELCNISQLHRYSDDVLYSVLSNLKGNYDPDKPNILFIADTKDHNGSFENFGLWNNEIGRLIDRNNVFLFEASDDPEYFESVRVVGELLAESGLKIDKVAFGGHGGNVCVGSLGITYVREHFADLRPYFSDSPEFIFFGCSNSSELEDEIEEIRQRRVQWEQKREEARSKLESATEDFMRELYESSIRVAEVGIENCDALVVVLQSNNYKYDNIVRAVLEEIGIEGARAYGQSGVGALVLMTSDGRFHGDTSPVIHSRGARSYEFRDGAVVELNPVNFAASVSHSGSETSACVSIGGDYNNLRLNFGFEDDRLRSGSIEFGHNYLGLMYVFGGVSVNPGDVSLGDSFRIEAGLAGALRPEQSHRHYPWLFNPYVRLGFQDDARNLGLFLNTGFRFGFNNIGPLSFSVGADYRFVSQPDIERTLLEANVAFDLCHELALHAGYEFVNNIGMNRPNEERITGAIEWNVGGYQLFFNVAYRPRDDEFEVGVTFNSNNLGPILSELFG